MDRMTLARASAALRTALHVLFIGLTIFVAIDALVRPSDHAAAVVALAIVILATYVAGVALYDASTPLWTVATGLLVLSAEWVALFVLSPTAAFLAFPMFFLYLYTLPARWALPSVAAATAVVVVLYGWHRGYNVGAVIGPIVGAAVAVAFVGGFRTLQREVRHRQVLIDELVEARDELARREHEAGVLSERSRLAREIHDTVAQGLSSIQLLLHAAERADADHAALDHIRLARETAAANLAETRRFIEARPPVALQNQTLANALERLAVGSEPPQVTVTVDGEPGELPMPIETALLRVAQEALTNVRRHANASRAAITLTYMGDAVTLDVVDDGDGFDPGDLADAGARPFGITGMRARVEELGGSFSIESQAGSGVAVAAAFGSQP
ncbi:sensor histidine kinase [Solicola gregarius]|uniref:Histidine kinase n=1 Tax=Solicola gregarius TaxID=2908642 RepID=A0AA46TI38_9ACTN|nr:histidine kinase [Solicola gregarius]UYM05716.1 histidine kinase [Solicola gregarius]